MKPIYLVALILAGCPLPPEDGARSGSQQGGQGNAANRSGGFGGAMADPNGNRGGQQGGQKEIKDGQLMDLSAMLPQQSQSEIQSGDHVTVSGTITGDCTGSLRVDVINTQIQGPGEDGKEPGPLASVSLSEVGAYSIAAPKGQSIKLAAICDVNSDEKVTEGVDLLSLEARPGVLEADLGGVDLQLIEIKPGGGPGTGAPAGGKGPGAPGAPSEQK